ncbi:MULTISPECIES: hypothetical protein [unclassified Pseudomonas]|uniref:DUF6916 family protein n=1 Tax=unclassified Pseudomonas TaxID=196821 RepID=UPI002448140D|nr:MULTISPECIES: hypothetical protein [unclassified Pseudomonas]MDH0897655.1 hypothetical protein [Pseudomonas sp. GD03875]MDH1067738.1 hypothetical protein [Pseudomonas sp. GD03985]
MLHQVEACHFQPLLGIVHPLLLSDGRVLEVRIDQIDLKPQSQMPGSRMPFAVALSVAGQTDFVDGLCALELPEIGMLDGLFVSRVPNMGRDAGTAYFQVAFN